MKKDFEHALRRARIRCGVNLLLELTWRVLAVAGIAALGVVLLHKLLGPALVQPVSGWVAAVLAAAVLATLWWFKRPTRMEVAVLVDERLGLKERFSSCLALAGRDDPFAQAACAEARLRAQDVTIDKQFPIRPDRRWTYAIVVWAVVIGTGLWLPRKDLLGRLHAKEQEQKAVEERQAAQTAIVETVKPLEQAARQLGDEKLAQELEELTKQAEAPLQPPELKRQAIRKLNSLAEQLQQLQADQQMASLDLMQEMFKQLQPAPNDALRRIQQALAKGEFSQAADLLRQLQEQIEAGELSDAQKAELSAQLQQMARQLQALADQKSQLEAELQKLGLDKSLAQMNPAQLRQALEKMNLSEAQIARLVQSASACQGAGQRAGQFAQALNAAAAAATMTGDDLAALIGQAAQLGDLADQMQLTEAMIQRLYAAGQCLGQGLGGRGSRQSWAAFGRPGRGAGLGPPARTRGTPSEGPAPTELSGVRSPNQDGPIVASFYFKGEQIKGEAQRDYHDVVRAGRDLAAEAVTNNEIPRKYAESVRQYFSRLEAEAPTTDPSETPVSP